MFAHVFKYRLKCLLRDKSTIFWTMLFPLMLATFFQLAFSNLTTGEKFTAINIAVVDNTAWQENESFRQVMDEVSTGEDRLFNLTVVSADEADKLLKDNKISGYILADEPIQLVVSMSGINQSIIKSFIDNYMQSSATFKSIMAEDPSKAAQLAKVLGDRQTYVRENKLPGGEPNYVVNYFYSLIAMSCFYGGFMGMREISDIQANISPIAARVNVAPVHKLKTFVYSSAASLSILFSELLILLGYITLVLKVEFGGRIGYILLTTFIGSIAGLTFGSFISVLVKKSEGAKVGILIASTMICSFLAGMMQQSIKFLISQKIPLLSWINPLNLLTDAFYSLYYYDTLTRYGLNMIILIGFILVFGSVTYFIIRRRKYASL
ncbi:MAG: ABC transporter permease [Thermoclostridium sp.]|nr:ABC transporter permease [Thermoclostridium sp.]